MLRLVNAWGIQEHHLHILLGQHAHDAVAGSLWLVRHNSNLLANEAVNQGRLAYIWPANHCYKARLMYLGINLKFSG